MDTSRAVPKGVPPSAAFPLTIIPDAGTQSAETPLFAQINYLAISAPWLVLKFTTRNQETKLFGGISRDFGRDIPGGARKAREEIVCVQFLSPNLQMKEVQAIRHLTRNMSPALL